MIDWLIPDEIQSPLPAMTRPAKTKPVSLSAPATTALDWANTHTAFWEWTAEWPRVCQRDQKSADGGENFSIAFPSSSPSAARNQRLWQTDTHQGTKAVHIPLHLKVAAVLWVKADSEGLETKATWQTMDGHTVLASYYNCPLCILAINVQANCLLPIPIKLLFNFLLFFSAVVSSSELTFPIFFFTFQHRFVLWINHIPHMAFLAYGLFLATLLRNKNRKICRDLLPDQDWEQLVPPQQGRLLNWNQVLVFLLFVNVVFRWLCKNRGLPCLICTLQPQAESIFLSFLVCLYFSNHKHTSRLHRWQEALSTHNLTQGHTLSCHPVHHTGQSTYIYKWS